MAFEDIRADAMRCTRCAYCKWIPFDLVKSWRFAKGCPSIEFGKFHSYSAGGRLVTALSLMDGRSTVTEPVKDSVFKCNMCGLCDVTCKMCRYDMEPLQDLHELRFKLVEDGHTLPQLEPVMDGLRRELNMLQQPKAARGDWMQELKLKDLTQEKAEFVFHAGCRYSFDGDLGHVARTSVRILQGAGVDFGVLGAARAVLRRAGVPHGLSEGLRDARAQHAGALGAGRGEDRHHAVFRLLPHLQAPLPGRVRIRA